MEYHLHVGITDIPANGQVNTPLNNVLDCLKYKQHQEILIGFATKNINLYLTFY